MDLTNLEFPLWLRLTHYINVLFIGLLIRSGIEILGAHPRLYWNDGCTPRTEWIKFTKKRVPTEKGVIYTARDDEVAISSWKEDRARIPCFTAEVRRFELTSIMSLP